MSTNFNIAYPKRVLMIVSNAGQSPVTGWPVGFWWAELTHPYWAFKEAGYEVDVASPQGGRVEADLYSDPEHESDYSADDIVSLGFKKSAQHAALLEQTKSLREVDIKTYDAIFVVGGQAPMVTMVADKVLHKFIVDAYEKGKVVGLVCHATCILLHSRLSNGDLLVKNKTWTGFANSEEQYAEKAVGMKLQPFWIETEARKIEQTNFIVRAAFRSHAVRDGRLVTGQQQSSGAAAAALVIDAVGR